MRSWFNLEERILTRLATHTPNEFIQSAYDGWKDGSLGDEDLPHIWHFVVVARASRGYDASQDPFLKEPPPFLREC